MPSDGAALPASLLVFRYRPADGALVPLVGEGPPPLPLEELRQRAEDALARQTFVCHAPTVPSGEEADELCLVPLGDHCEILAIHTRGHRRHHGDHRRSLVDILNDLAAAVARGRLRLLDEAECAAARSAGREALRFLIDGTPALQSARQAVELLLADAGLPDLHRQRTILCISEAVTNMLVHGGGGEMTVRRLPDRVRVVVADAGPGLNFLNWLEPPSPHGQVSMGYGYRIMLEHLDAVGLHTGPGGTTVILDRLVPAPAPQPHATQETPC